MGSTCYDASGITFPKKKTLEIENIVTDHLGIDLKWSNQFGWSNQPEVITFQFVNDNRAALAHKLLDETLNKFGLIVREQDWN